jgi:peroxiredoxin
MLNEEIRSVRAKTEFRQCRQSTKAPIKKEFKMPKLHIGDEAPDFILNDINGKKVSLQSFRNIKNVLIVLNRGFF